MKVRAAYFHRVAGLRDHADAKSDTRFQVVGLHSCFEVILQTLILYGGVTMM